MKRLVIGIVLLIASYGFGYPASNAPQGKVMLDSWKRVSACHISFLVPASVENLNARGIDSCVAAFGDSNIRISIDYGLYSAPYKERELRFAGELKGFKQEFIRVGGKRAQVVTYLYGSKNRQEYIAGMYVLVHTNKSLGMRMKTSLNMTVTGRSEKDQEIATRIFRSVRFQ